MTEENIAPALGELVRPIRGLREHPRNARRSNEEGIATSLARFGQLRPVLVQKSTRFVVQGNHTLRAAKLLGWKRIAAAVEPMTDADALAYLVADNRHSDAGENDDQALLLVLDRLADDGSLAGTGYTADDVDDLHALLGATETPVEEFQGGHAEGAPEPREGVSGAGQMPLREVVLSMTTQQADAFGRQVKRLASAYDTTGVAQTVREAARRELAEQDAR